MQITVVILNPMKNGSVFQKTNYKDLDSGPVEIDIQEGAAAVIDKLWPTESPKKTENSMFLT